MKALTATVEAVSKEVSPAIQTLKTAHEAWSKLVDYFDRDSTMRVVTLLGQLFNLNFPRSISMQSFLMKIKPVHDHSWL